MKHLISQDQKNSEAEETAINEECDVINVSISSHHIEVESGIPRHRTLGILRKFI